MNPKDETLQAMLEQARVADDGNTLTSLTLALTATRTGLIVPKLVILPRSSIFARLVERWPDAQILGLPVEVSDKIDVPLIGSHRPRHSWENA